MPIAAETPVLALGAELKNAVCTLTGTIADVSDAFGHLGQTDAYRAFLGEVQRRLDALAGQPVQLAADLHPDYLATRRAKQLGQPCTFVQHHHAHIVACMADNSLTGPVIGVAADGTGYGTDGTIWGCEILAANESHFVRAGRLRPWLLGGGDIAAVECWRSAIGLLADTFGPDWQDRTETILRRVDPDALVLVAERLASPAARLPVTSSLGRLFDAVAFLTGIAEQNDTEAAAPIALQVAAERAPSAPHLDWALGETDDAGLEMDSRPLIRSIVSELQVGRPAEEVARGFHEAFAHMLAACVDAACEKYGQNRVVLSGGCFLNGLLTGQLQELLQASGREVYTHRQLSPGDACIAVGQAVIAAAQARDENGHHDQ